METDISFSILTTRKPSKDLVAVQQLLESYQLDLEEDVENFVVAYAGKQVVACAGIINNLVKCVAISSELRGENLSAKLINEVVNYAADQGHFHLFLYTKPESATFFQGCGFYTLAEVPNLVTFMENTPIGISRYCEGLAALSQVGDKDKIGSIVMNANPFTLGHRYLAEQVASQCDWLHLFVVSEDSSMFSFADRLLLIRQGVADIPNITVHPGSQYMISKATFPSYFIKEKGLVDQAFTAIDLLMFRNHIAPALKITHRFVGSEPFCAVTQKYNEDMKCWLQNENTTTAPITVVEIERKESDSGTKISASEVRALLEAHDFTNIQDIVPQSTWQFLKNNYM